MEFIASNYIIFIIVATVLLLGLIGYIVDRKKYEKYRKELLNEEVNIPNLKNDINMNDRAPIINSSSAQITPAPLVNVEDENVDDVDIIE